MSGELIRPGDRDLGFPFKPETARQDQHALRQLANTAAALRRWEDMEKAIDILIQHQVEIVEWWNEHVGVRLHAGSKLNAHRHSTLSCEEAERLTGIKQWQTSRWRTALEDEAAYRARQILAARRPA